MLYGDAGNQGVAEEVSIAGVLDQGPDERLDGWGNHRAHMFAAEM